MRNADRSARTRAALMDAAQPLFARDGFAATSTDAILEGAGVKRGALYHHFTDKADLFSAVCARLSAQAAAAVLRAAEAAPTAGAALCDGSIAWLRFMLGGEARRILVVEAPSVLGLDRWHALDQAHSFQLLREGVAAAIASGDLPHHGDGELLAVVLNGAMNALVLRGGPAAPAEQALVDLFRSLGLRTGGESVLRRSD